MAANTIKRSTGEKIFEVFNILLMSVLIIVMLYPMLHVLFASFSDSTMMSGYRGLMLGPRGFSTESYRMMAKNPMILKGYGNTLFIVGVGVVINILFTSVAAYFLSRKQVLFRNFIMILIVFTMYFSGGMIPFYLTVKELGLENSLWALILPNAINTFNLIIMRTSFMALPDSLEESARIDGAGHFTILFRIIMPLSKAVIAVMVLYYAVDYWNAWFNAMLFISKRSLYPLQLILREILIQNDTSVMTQNVAVGEQSMVGETIKYAVIIVSTVPILCVYPFIQKYFAKGVMIGALKG